MMGLYGDLGIRDDMTDAELATYLSSQRSIWNSKRSAPDMRERMRAEQMVRYIDVLAGAEARIGDFPAPALVIKTLCVAIDNKYADYRGLEDAVLRSVGSGIYRGEFRTVLGYLNSNGAQDVAREWRRTLRRMGVDLPPAREMSRGSSERSEQREYLERHNQNVHRGNRDEKVSDDAADTVEHVNSSEVSSENDMSAAVPGGSETPDDGRRADREPHGSGIERSGRSNTRRRRKLPWRRKVRRFFRRLWRNIRRADWSSVPRLPLIIAAVIAALIIIMVIASNIRRSGGSTTGQQAAAEETTASTTAAVQEAQAEQEALISRLRGMENYTISTDTSESGPVSTLTAVNPANCSASSVLVGVTTGKAYGPEYLFDGDMTTNWQEGEEDAGIGVTITSTFASQTDVKGIAIWGGNESSPESYTANNRPEQITVSVSCQGQSYSKAYTLEDVDGVQTILFDSAVPMESVVIRIDSVYSGSSYNDTVITELAFLTEN